MITLLFSAQAQDWGYSGIEFVNKTDVELEFRVNGLERPEERVKAVAPGALELVGLQEVNRVQPSQDYKIEVRTKGAETWVEDRVTTIESGYTYTFTYDSSALEALGIEAVAPNEEPVEVVTDEPSAVDAVGLYPSKQPHL